MNPYRVPPYIARSAGIVQNTTDEEAAAAVTQAISTFDNFSAANYFVFSTILLMIFGLK